MKVISDDIKKGEFKSVYLLYGEEEYLKKQYNLSEELYMKMNARGLPLSVFDNFKAEFTGALRKCKTLTEEKVDLEGGIQNEL